MTLPFCRWAAPRRRPSRPRQRGGRGLSPIPNAWLSKGIGYGGGIGLPFDVWPAFAAGMEAHVKDHVESANIGELLLEMGIGIPSGAGDDAPAWIKLGFAMAPIGIAIVQARAGFDPEQFRKERREASEKPQKEAAPREQETGFFYPDDSSTWAG